VSPVRRPRDDRTPGERVGRASHRFCLIELEGDYEQLERIPVIGTAERSATVEDLVVGR
jgi:hypothetical protein